MCYFNKVISSLINPLGIAIMTGAIAFVCWKFNRNRTAKGLWVFTITWMLLWMSPLMTRCIGKSLESEFLIDNRVPIASNYGEVDFIVVLGGSMSWNEKLCEYAEMSMSADRVWHAARLCKAKKAQYIIATGNLVQKTTLGLLKDLGINEHETIFLEARNTEEEAKSVNNLLKELERKKKVVKPKILLVTSAWHMRRARLMFEKYCEGVEVICAPTDFEMSMATANDFGLREIFPDYNAFARNSVAFHEIAGFFWYKVFR